MNTSKKDDPKEVFPEVKVAMRCFSSKSVGVFKDGYWTITSDTEEGRKLNDLPWEFRTIAAKAIDRDFQKAYEVTLKSLNRQLADLKGDLFNKPEGSDNARIPYPTDYSQAPEVESSSNKTD